MTVAAQSEDLIHLFSYETAVSFELPVAWECSTEGAGVAEYAIDDDGDGNPEPDADLVRFTVMAVGHGDAADGYARLSDELETASTRTVIDQHEWPLDGGVVRVVVSQGPGAADGPEVTVVQGVAQRGGRLWVLRGTSPARSRSFYRPVFEAAIASARFIELGER